MLLPVMMVGRRAGARKIVERRRKVGVVRGGSVCAGLRCVAWSSVTQDSSRWRRDTPSALCARPSPQREERQPQPYSVTPAEVEKRRASCLLTRVIARHEEVGDPAGQPEVGVSVMLVAG